MTTVISKLDKMDAWWWHQSTATRWFIGAIGAALVFGIAGGILG